MLNGLLVRKNLALNRHWYDVLMDFFPTTLIIDLNDSVNLSKFKPFKFENTEIREGIMELYDVYGMKDRFDVYLLQWRLR